MPEAEKDLNYWINLKKTACLIENIQKEPFEDIGKPEQLKHSLTGIWSRRINREHHNIYEIVDDKILIYSVKGHYK